MDQNFSNIIEKSAKLIIEFQKTQHWNSGWKQNLKKTFEFEIFLK